MDAQINMAKISKYLPATTKFSWTKTGSELIKLSAIIQQCIQKNSITPLYRKLEGILSDIEKKELNAYITEIKEAMSSDFSEDQIEESIMANRSAIYRMLWDKDSVNPIRQLIQNSAESWFFYSLEMNIDINMIHDDADRWIERERVKRALGIQENRSENINALMDELINNSTQGGELRIYFRAPLQSLTKETVDFKEVHIWGREVFIAIVNSDHCMGYDIILPINITIPFKRKDLYFDQAMPYSYIDDLYSKDIEHWNDNTSFIPLAKYSGDNINH